MKTISSLKLRNNLGEVLDEVRFTLKPVVVLKNDNPIVKIVPLERAKKRSHFSLTRYRKIVKSLRPEYQVGDPDPDLLEIVGSGDYIPLEQEKEMIYQYLDEKYR